MVVLNWEALRSALFGCYNIGEFIQVYATRLGAIFENGPDGPILKRRPAQGGAEIDLEEFKLQTRAAHYLDVLGRGEDRYHWVPQPDWLTITAELFNASLGRRVKRQGLHDTIEDKGADAKIEGARDKVRAAVFQVFCSGCYQPAEPALKVTTKDLYESECEVQLVPEIRTAEDLRRRARAHIFRVLRERLSRCSPPEAGRSYTLVL
jgi:hypothetical protein